MAKRSHNKKRNVGIIYEQLVLKLSEALIENNDTEFRKIKKILKKHYSKDSELYKEFRLLNSLAVTNIEAPSLATRILGETRSAARRIKSKRLELERSQLIKEINHSMGSDFYKKKISNYRDLATIQRLLDEYRKWENADPKFLNEYESKVHKILLEHKQTKKLEEMKDPEVNPLVLKIMTEKFNSLYSEELTTRQIAILKEWSFNKGSEKLSRMCKAVQQSAVTEINKFQKANDNKIVDTKISTVLTEIKEVSFENLNDDLISKALIMCKIKDELAGELS
jgi:hypothetical protein